MASDGTRRTRAWRCVAGKGKLMEPPKPAPKPTTAPKPEPKPAAAACPRVDGGAERTLCVFCACPFSDSSSDVHNYTECMELKETRIVHMFTFFSSPAAQLRALGRAPATW